MNVCYPRPDTPVDALDVDPGAQPWQPILIDPYTADVISPLTNVPADGDAAAVLALGAKLPEPVVPLAAFLRTWPDVRRYLDERVTKRMRRDPTFYGYCAHYQINELDKALKGIAAIIADLVDES